MKLIDLILYGNVFAKHQSTECHLMPITTDIMRTSITRNEPYDALIITVSKGMYGEKGYRNWLRNFMDAMHNDSCIYWFRAGAQPKQDVLHVYICIGNKIRFKVKYAGSEGEREQMFDDGRIMHGKAWIAVCGPLEMRSMRLRPRRSGFQGFRYTQELW
jgi:hypothetical protein